MGSLKDRLGARQLEGYIRETRSLVSLHTLTFIAEHQELSRRSRASQELMKEKVVEAKAIVEEEKLCKREVAFGNLFPFFLDEYYLAFFDRPFVQTSHGSINR